MKSINLYHMAQLIANMKKSDKELLGHYLLTEEGILDNDNEIVKDEKSLELQATELFIKGWQEESQLLELVRENHNNIDISSELYRLDDRYIQKQFSEIKTDKTKFFIAGERILFKYFEKDNSYGLQMEDSKKWFTKGLKKSFAYWLLTHSQYVNSIRLLVNFGEYDISLIEINEQLIEVGLSRTTAYFKKVNKTKFKKLYYKKLGEQRYSELNEWLDSLAYKRELQKENIYDDEDISFGEQFIDEAIEEINRCFDILDSYAQYSELRNYILSKQEEI